MKDIPGVSSVETLEWQTGVGVRYKGQPLGDPDESIQADSGSIRVELDSGAVLVFWNSEWGGLDYYAPKAEGR